MFEGGTEETPAIYSVYYLGKAGEPIGYLEIAQEGTDSTVSASLAEDIDWPIQVPENGGVIFERVPKIPNGDFPENEAARLSWREWIPSGGVPQIPDGGFEIGKQSESGWVQDGLALMRGYPSQRNLIGRPASEFPISAEIGEKFRITNRDDFETEEELHAALDQDFGDNGWFGFEFEELYEE